MWQVVHLDVTQLSSMPIAGWMPLYGESVNRILVKHRHEKQKKVALPKTINRE